MIGRRPAATRATWRPPSTLTTSRHPLTIVTFVFSAVGGSWGLLVPGGTSSAVDRVLPDWFVAVYYAGMAVFGLLGLYALAAIGDLDTRARAERAVWYGIGWPAIFYAAAAFVAVGRSAGQPAWGATAVSAGATWRIIQITVERRRILRDRVADRPADPPPLGVADEPGP